EGVQHAVESRDPPPIVRLDRALRRELRAPRGRAPLLVAEGAARIAGLRAVDAQVRVRVDVTHDASEVHADGMARAAVLAEVEYGALAPSPGVDEGCHGRTLMAADRASRSGPITRPSGFTKRKSRPTRKGSSHAVCEQAAGEGGGVQAACPAREGFWTIQ